MQYIGWKNSEKIYQEFAAADLIAFPGLHSVLWEQAVGLGKACVFRKINGFSHIDMQGNCLYFEEDTIDSYSQTILSAIEQLDALQTVAKEKGMVTFSYQKIAIIV